MYSHFPLYWSRCYVTKKLVLIPAVRYFRNVEKMKLVTSSTITCNISRPYNHVSSPVAYSFSHNSFPFENRSCVKSRLLPERRTTLVLQGIDLRYRHQEATEKTKVKPKRLKGTVYYLLATGVLCLGLSYAAVPLYRIFCQAFNYGGVISAGNDISRVEEMTVVPDRLLRITFNADTASSMRWSFKPQQYELFLHPGETALAFYTAINPTDKAIDGISTYNVIPFEAGQYFNKIQCFCFEEQRLNPHEKVDMPVFFYIDPEFVEDPKMEKVNEIVLSYTFFESKEGLTLPVPPYMK